MNRTREINMVMKVNERERDLIKANAAKNGLTVSAYLRYLLMHGIEKK